MNPTIDRSTPCVRIIGASRSGKSRVLVRHAVELIESGAKPATILMLASSPAAVATLRDAMTDAGDPKGDGPRIATAAGVARAILSAERAPADEVRLLVPHEAAFAFLSAACRQTDMNRKAFERKVRRGLRKGLPSDRWSLSDEEAACWKMLESWLDARDAMLVDQLPSRAKKIVETDGAPFDHVLCDDFTSMSPAEQDLALSLARFQIVATGNDALGANPASDARFARLAREEGSRDIFLRNGERHVAPDSLRRFAYAIEHIDERPEKLPFDDTLTIVKWKTAAEELYGMARAVAAYTGKPSADASRVCVAVPTLERARAAQAALETHGVPTTTFAAQGLLAEAFSTKKGMKAFTALSLIADPTDRISRELWEYLEEDPERGASFAREHAQGRARSLLQACGMRGIAGLDDVTMRLSGDERAQELLEVFREQLLEPTPPARMRRVCIATYDAVRGMSFDRMFALSCVDGLVPGCLAFTAPTEAQRSAIAARDSIAFARALAKADEAVVSFFAKERADRADRMHVHTIRTKAEHGCMVAMARPSSAIARARIAAPGAIGGDMFLRERELN